MGYDVVLYSADWPGKSFYPASGNDVWRFGSFISCLLFKLLVLLAGINSLPCTVGLAASQNKKRNYSFAESLLNRFPEKYEELVIAPWKQKS